MAQSTPGMQTAMAKPPRWVAESGPRLIIAAAVVSVAYYVGAQVGFALRFPTSPISMLWPPNSLLLAAFLLVPTRRWWIILVAALPAHLAVQIQNDVPPALMLGLFLTNSGQGLIGAAALRRFVPGPFRLDSLQRVGLFLVFAAFLAPMLIAFVAAALIVGTAWGEDYWLSWRAQLLSNILTVLTLVPAILAVAASETDWFRRSAARRWAEAGLLVAGLAVASWLVFSPEPTSPAEYPALLFAPMPFFLWAALRFGTGGLSLSVLFVAVWAVVYAASGPRPFDVLSPFENVVSLQLYLIAASVPLLALAALVREREYAMEMLRASEERFRTVVEAAPIGIATQDATGQLTSHNPAWRAFLGYTAVDFVGRDFWEVTHPADLQRNHALFDEMRAGLRDTYAMEKRYYRKDGRLVWGGLTVAAVRDEAGKLRHTVSMVEDITARKRAEDALRESETRFRLMADHAPVMIWVLDEEGQLTFFNKATLQFLGLSSESAFADWSKAVHLDDRAHLAEISRSAWLARQPFDTEYRIRRADGIYRWIALQAVPRLAPDGAFLGYIGSALDVTERKRAEDDLHQLSARLLQLQDEERRRIARDLHDMTAQELFALTINLARLQQLVPDPGMAVQDLLADSRALGDQALQDLRTLSYLLHPPLLDQVGLVSALEWYVDGFRQRSGIDVALAISGDTGRLPPDVETALFRIVQEGLANIHRHSGSGTASIALDRECDAIRLLMEDHGRGIATYHAPGSQDELPALGIGIPGMRERVRQLGGRLEVVSSAQGTSVSAIVPLAIVPLKEESVP
jgi:two-component system NarL family sensor kinase